MACSQISPGVGEFFDMRCLLLNLSCSIELGINITNDRTYFSVDDNICSLNDNICSLNDNIRSLNDNICSLEVLKMNYSNSLNKLSIVRKY